MIFSFPAERAIINRERSSGYYRDISYFLGKQLCELPRAVFFNMLMLIIVYFMAGLNQNAGAFFTLLLVCVGVAFSAEGMSQALSVFTGNEQAAAAIVPVFVILQVLFGGFFILPGAFPGYIAWARYLSFIYYGYNAATQNEFIGRGDNGIDDVIVDSLETSVGKWGNIGILLGFVAVFKMAYFVALVQQRPRFDRKL